MGQTKFEWQQPGNKIIYPNNNVSDHWKETTASKTDFAWNFRGGHSYNILDDKEKKVVYPLAEQKAGYYFMCRNSIKDIKDIKDCDNIFNSPVTYYYDDSKEDYTQDVFTCPNGTQKVNCLNDSNKVVCINENDSTGDKVNEYVTKCDIPYLNNVCRDQKQFNKSVYKALKYADRRETNRIWVKYGLFHLVCMFIALYLAMQRPPEHRVGHIILAILFSPLYILAVGSDYLISRSKEE